MHGVSVKLSGTLGSGTVKASLGSAGSVSMKFRPTARAKTTKPSKGCTGGVTKSRKGILRGTFRLVIDKGYFKTIRAIKLPAVVSISGKQTCKSGSGSGSKPEPQRTSLGNVGAGTLSFSATKNGDGTVNQQVSVQKIGKNAQIFHSISVNRAPASSFTAADNASTAHVDAAGPFLSGAANFTGTDFYDGGANGKLSGNFAAKFDSIGTQKPFAAGNIEGFLQKPGFKPPPPPNKPPTADLVANQDSPDALAVSFND